MEKPYLDVNLIPDDYFHSRKVFVFWFSISIPLSLAEGLLLSFLICPYSLVQTLRAHGDSESSELSETEL